MDSPIIKYFHSKYLFIMKATQKLQFMQQSSKMSASRASSVSFKIIFLLNFIIKSFNCELYSAKIELEILLETQLIVTYQLENYLQEEEDSLRNIREKILQFKEIGKRENSNLQKNVELHHGSIESFRIIKRLAIDLNEILKDFSKRRELKIFKELNSTIIVLKSQLNFPHKKDLAGAALALGRVQSVYNLNVSQMAEGYLNEFCCEEKLDFDDCFAIANELYDAYKYRQAYFWFELAYEKYKNEKMNDTKKEFDLYGGIYSTSYEIGLNDKAIEYAKKVLEIEPDQELTKGNLEHFLNTASESKDIHPDQEKHNKLCRGEVLGKSNAKLKCKYTTNNFPQLLIAPYKEEIVNLDPKVSVFHEVISDKEIREIIKKSIPRLRRTVVFKSARKTDPSEVRVSKGGWVNGLETEATKKLSIRLEEFTGLSDVYSEEFNVVNYGLGGQYEMHHDYIQYEQKTIFDDNGMGNRIATVLFYLSDVELGGYTVFPEMNLSLKPRKGSAAFWYNLHEDGYTDSRTIHAGCPVVYGTKWIINKWVHESGQEFLRPCKLQPWKRKS